MVEEVFMEDRKLKLNLDEEEVFEDGLEIIPMELKYDIKPGSNYQFV